MLDGTTFEEVSVTRCVVPCDDPPTECGDDSVCTPVFDFSNMAADFTSGYCFPKALL